MSWISTVGARVSRLLMGGLLVAAAGCAWLTTPPANAAQPETPLLEAPSVVKATTAELHGVLDPDHEGDLGTTYEFVYRASAGECEGGSSTPEPPGESLGFEHEEITQELTGLEPDTEYTACLIARNGGESSRSAPVHFKTKIALEAPELEPGRILVAATSATVYGVLNPAHEGEPGSYQIGYERSSTTCEGHRSPETAVESAGHQHEQVHLVLGGLFPDTTYTVCLVAENSFGEVERSPSATITTTTAAPTIDDEAAEAIGVSSATLHGAINPGGLPSTYRAEIVSEAQYQSEGWRGATILPVSGQAPLAAHTEPVAVSEHAGSLSAGTTYRFRFLSGNELGETQGAEQTFTALQADEPSALPDRRVDELVSTAANGGEPYSPYSPASEETQPNSATAEPFQARADGDAIVYTGDDTEGDSGNGSVGNSFGNQWLAERSQSGWVTSDISPASNTSLFEAFSESLQTGYLIEGGELLAPLAPPSCDDLYSVATGTRAYSAILNETQTPGSCGQPLFAGASADSSVAIFQSEAALTQDAPATPEVPSGSAQHQREGENGTLLEGCAFGCNLYESREGRLHLVNVLPDEEPVESANFGGYEDDLPESEALNEPPSLDGAISSDGSRIFWTDTQSGPNFEHVYVRENGTETVQVSGEGQAQFWAASPDGRYGYYVEAGQLWQFDTISNTRVPLTEAGSGVLGLLGLNTEGAPGAYVYFVATGVLASNTTSDGESAVVGHPNLYLRHGEKIVFIATLDLSDDNIFGAIGGGRRNAHGDWRPDLGRRTAQVTPDGTHVVFQSTRELTGFADPDPVKGTSQTDLPISQAFEYQTQTEDISCVSCNPRGAIQPVGEASAAVLPLSEASLTRMDHWLSSDGERVFFETQQSLSPREAPSKRMKVYEWEAIGEGGCTSQLADERNEGCVFAVSPAYSETPSYFVEADLTGANVFFEHRGPTGAIVGQDARNALYDARIDGGFAPPASGCHGGECPAGQSTAAPEAPPSETAPAGANLIPATIAKPKPAAAPKPSKQARLRKALATCRKDRSRKRRERCEKAARAKFAARKNVKRAGSK